MFYKFSVKIIPNHFFIQFLQIDLYKLVIRILRAKYKLGLAPATIAKFFSESYGIPLPLPVTSGTQRHHEGEGAVIPRAEPPSYRAHPHRTRKQCECPHASAQNT